MRKLLNLLLHPRLAVVAHDLLMVWVAWLATYYARYSLWPDAPPVPWFAMDSVLVLVVQGVVLWWTGLYRGLWRFASMPDVLNIIRAAVLGTLLISLGLFLINRLEGVPRSVFVLYPVALVVLLGAPRVLYRYWKDMRSEFGGDSTRQRVLVLGAGRTGEMLVRDMRREGEYRPVGLLDDDNRLRGAKVHGVPVLGSIDRLPRVAEETAADIIVIAMPAASAEQMQRVVSICEETDRPFRTLPRLEDVVAGRYGPNELREVAIEDLLGREPIALDWQAISRGLSGKRVLVTGGGGSIGSELARQIARLGPVELMVCDNGEFNLYEVQRQFKDQFPDLRLTAVLADVTDAAAMNFHMSQFAPDVVFHAAAYKHVPMLEGQIREGIRNNVLGTVVAAQAASKNKVESFVLISTDKAVNPVNLMGATKRAAEIYCQVLAKRSTTRFVTVRFGNVLDSAGSVVPLFREQIRKGGPVTVTDPQVSRYFMTIPEACQLILQAAVIGRGDEIFVLDMGEPVLIAFLAEQMIRLAGKRPHQDIDIRYTGLRPGEKLNEELFHDHEKYRPTDHENILQATHRRPDPDAVERVIVRMQTAVDDFDEASLSRALRDLVPALSTAPDEPTVVPFLPARNQAGPRGTS